MHTCMVLNFYCCSDLEIANMKIYKLNEKLIKLNAPFGFPA
jgi:hypothetical protein